MHKDELGFWQSLALTFALLSATNAAFASVFHEQELVVLNVLLVLINIGIFFTLERLRLKK